MPFHPLSDTSSDGLDAYANGIIAMAGKLFPEYFKLQELELKLKKIQWERAELAHPKFYGTNAYVLKVVETNQLRCVILDFENHQGKRVEAILKQHQHALERAADARQAKVTNTVKKGMPIVEEHNFMKWETDTDVGEVNQPKDAFDEVIAKAEEELEELSDKFTYEAMLHNMLMADMKTFIGIAKLAKHEAALWVPKNSDKEDHKVFRPIETCELQKCKDEAFAWMKAASIHYIELEQQQAGLGGKQNDLHGEGNAMIISSGGGSHDEAVASCTYGGGINNGHDEAAAFPQLQTDWQPNYCTYCKKWGHIDRYCPAMFPEEDQPDYCDICNKEGHTEERCWIIHPELKFEWLAKQDAKQKRMTCHHCGKTGHIRRWCHLLHE